jgi:predicted Abi (CAAX) family protease
MRRWGTLTEDSRVTDRVTLTGAVGEIIAGLRRLPDLRAAIEALALFILIILAGIWATQAGLLQLNPAPRSQISGLWLPVFVFPALAEELAFRGWLPRGRSTAALVSFLAYVAWHPLQAMLGLPTARPEFLQPAFLVLVACLGFICTLTRVRSGSIWPGVILHWGVAVAWLALFGGPPAADAAVQRP